jgi:hypothetical protein
MFIVKQNCADWIAGSRLPRGSLELAGERSMALYRQDPGDGAWICLFRYRQPISGDAMEAAVKRNWQGSVTVQSV